MKTFKAFEFSLIKNTQLTILFTLHHVSCGIYWAAPALMDRRRISVSLHLPFFMLTAAWVKVIKDIDTVA